MARAELTEAQVQAVLRRDLGEEAAGTLLWYELVRHSAERLGFLGEYTNLLVALAGPEPGKTEHRSYFVKTPPRSSERQVAFMREAKIFEQESAFHGRVAAALMDGFVGAQFLPRCLLAGERVLVLEDMRAKGYRMLERRFEAAHLRAAVRAQARLHAASLLAEARLGRPLDQFCGQACVEHLYTPASLEPRRMGLYVEMVETAARRLGREPGRLAPALRRGFRRIQRSAGRGRLGRVLCHGDTWPNNYLFGPEAGCVLVDFQLARYAPRTYDVAQLLYLAADRALRGRCERELLEAYHRELCAALARSAGALEGPSLGELLEEFEDVRLSAMYAYLLYQPILGVCAEMRAEMERDIDRFYEDIMFRENNKVLLEMYERFPGYMSGLLELTEELLDYCEAHDVSAEDDEPEESGPR